LQGMQPFKGIGICALEQAVKGVRKLNENSRWAFKPLLST